jgi:PEGA domain
MGTRRRLGFVSAFFLLGAFLGSVRFACAGTEDYPLRLKVLSSETYPLKTGTPVPTNCDLQNFDAYCNESRNPTSQSILVVEDDQGKSYRVECTMDSRWSKCTPLTIGETFEARKDKRGITIVYHNAKGKSEKQLYKVVASLAAQEPPAAPAPKSGIAHEPAPPTSPPPASPVPAPEPTAPTAPAQSAPAPQPIPGNDEARENFPGKVKCNFTSTPPGADITVDGKYVGNTPSEIGLSTGKHVVTISMQGFANWKRELWVAPESVLNVTANLQKK